MSGEETAQKQEHQVITIASVGMEPLDTNGTNEVIPSNSPKRGDLFVLNTTIASDGGMDIQKTLLEPGEKTQDVEETSESAPVPENGNPIGSAPEAVHAEEADAEHAEPSHEEHPDQKTPPAAIPEEAPKVELEENTHNEAPMEETGQESSPEAIAAEETKVDHAEPISTEDKKEDTVPVEQPIQESSPEAIVAQETKADHAEPISTEDKKEDTVPVEQTIQESSLEAIVAEETKVDHAEPISTEDKKEDAVPVEQPDQEFSPEAIVAEEANVDHAESISTEDKNENAFPVKQPVQECSGEAVVAEEVNVDHAEPISTEDKKEDTVHVEQTVQESSPEPIVAEEAKVDHVEPISADDKKEDAVPVEQHIQESTPAAIVAEEAKVEHAEPTSKLDEQATKAGAEVVDAKDSEVSQDGKEAPSASQRKAKVRRTMTLPLGKRLTLPWQKRSVVDDSAELPAKKSKTPNPLSGMMKNIKKGLKIKGGGSSSGGDPAPGRIEQNSGDRPSPRIVSSLNITPTHQGDVQAAPLVTATEQDSPATRKKKLLEEISDDILTAMPPSPAPSVESVKQELEEEEEEEEEEGKADRQVNAPIYANLGADPTTPAEEVICPAMVNKPVITALHQAVNEKKAHDMMGAIMAGAPAENGAEHEERRDLGPKPPRPPPAKNGQTTPTKASPRNLPSPPRPQVPPRITPQVSPDIITPLVSASPVHAAPPTAADARASYAERTCSLDARKLYRSKEQTKAAKRATLGRPTTMHETTFHVKHISNLQVNQSFDESTPARPKSMGGTHKVVFERSDTFTLPKLPFLGSKKNKNKTNAVVARPQLISMSSMDAKRPSPLKPYVSPDVEDDVVSASITNVQCALPSAPQSATISIGVQTAPMRPKAPVTSLRHGTGKPTLLELSAARTNCRRRQPASKLEAALLRHESQLRRSRSQSPVHGPHPVPPSGAELALPHVGERLVQKIGTLPEDRVSACALQNIHSVWSDAEEASEKEEELASQKMVNKCLQQYMNTCIRLRSADLQGEFAAFHWQYGDVGEAGWFRRGVPAGWPTLNVYHAPTRQIDFIELPPIQYTPGSVVYPERTVDALLANWLDIGHTQAPSAPHPPNALDSDQTTFHPASTILRLSDMLRELGPECQGILRSSLVLAVLLSVDYCSTNLRDASTETSKSYLNYDPSKVLLLCSATNWLVLFQVVEEDHEPSLDGLLAQLAPEKGYSSLKDATEATIADLQKVSRSHLSVSSMIEAVAPPDWIMQAVARVGLGRSDAMASQN